MFSHFAHQAGRSHGEERVCAKDEIAREKIKETVLLSGLWQHRSARLYFLIREQGRVCILRGWVYFSRGDGLESICTRYALKHAKVRNSLAILCASLHSPKFKVSFPAVSDIW